LKDYFERARPLSVFGADGVKLFYEELYSKSFPSGHTQAAFAMAVFIFMTEAKARYKILCLCLAFFTAFERIYAGAHFPADVFTGAVLGSVCAFSIFKLSEISEKLKIKQPSDKSVKEKKRK
jgi:undecaprenyl-diphosphatase